jgi:hypothetical protein
MSDREDNPNLTEYGNGWEHGYADALDRATLALESTWLMWRTAEPGVNFVTELRTAMRALYKEEDRS